MALSPELEPAVRTRVLCVDDEPYVLEGLTLHLRRRYDVKTAPGGAEGLELLARDKTIAVVVSDMRMPGMDGAAFLHKSRQIVPDAVRLLLTGQTEINAAISAVNDGQIFRFLTKPCPPPTLLAAIDAAVSQHRLVTAERVLLERTLHGSIKILADVLALTNPVSFGRATRIKQHVSMLADKLQIEDRWQLEVAAMLSQIGWITLPNETAEKVHYGRPLSDAEQTMLDRLPTVTEQLLAHIPRLEVVRGIVANQRKPPKRSDPSLKDPQLQAIARGAHVLRVASDFEVLEGQGMPAARALDVMRGRGDQYDPEVFAAFHALRGAESVQIAIREIPLRSVSVGMVLAEDVKMQNGTLLVARGYEVTDGFVERVRNFSPGTVREPIRVTTGSRAKEPA